MLDSIFILFAGTMKLNSIPTEYRVQIEELLEHLFAITKPESTDIGSFELSSSTHCSMYVYTSSQVANSSVSMEVWNELGSISEVNTAVDTGPTTHLDLEPFHKDNVALAKERKTDGQLQAIVKNQVPAYDSAKYFWLISHRGMDWEEERRLYFCLKDREAELGVTVLDIFRDGQKWEKTLKNIFYDPALCTPFKGMLDIV